MPMRKHKTVIFLTLGFLVGVCILLYPAFSDFWNSKTQSRVILNYESVLDQMDQKDYSSIFEAAHTYNDTLYQTKNPLLNTVRKCSRNQDIVNKLKLYTTGGNGNG